jgi:hypothetical protein
MWKQAKVTVGDVTADQAMVDFEGQTPAVLEWPEPLEFNSQIKIGEETYFAEVATACAGKFHMPLMRAPLLPKDVPPALIEKLKTQTRFFENEVAKAEAEVPIRKGKKP